MNLYIEIPPPWRHDDSNSLLRLECDVWNSERICWNIFLKFIPTTCTFKTSVMNTKRYIRLKGQFQCKNSEVYLSFMCFAAQNIEIFLQRFQFEWHMIHILCHSMVEMIWSNMTKLLKKKYLVLEDSSPTKAEDIISINSLRSEVSSIGFLLVLMTHKECTVYL